MEDEVKIGRQLDLIQVIELLLRLDPHMVVVCAVLVLEHIDLVVAELLHLVCDLLEVSLHSLLLLVGKMVLILGHLYAFNLIQASQLVNV